MKTINITSDMFQSTMETLTSTYATLTMFTIHWQEEHVSTRGNKNMTSLLQTI